MSDQIREMFSQIAPSYDRGNDVLSFGLHRRWKHELVRAAGAPYGGRVLDLATGTGDIAVLFAEEVGEIGSVIGSDFNAEMIAQAKLRPKNQRPNLTFEIGDAMDLRFANDQFDICSISFGIRNVDDPVQALREMYRVVRPGGRVAVLEFGQPGGAFGAVYRFYSSQVLTRVGGLVSGRPEAYRYLDRTASNFPAGERFAALMRTAGFEQIRIIPLMGGIAYIYIGEVDAMGVNPRVATADVATPINTVNVDEQ